MENNKKDKGLNKTPKILQKSLEEYYYARMNEKVVPYEHVYDGISYASSTEVEDARRQIACLDNQLVKARTEWMEDKKVLDARWKACTERYNNCYENIPNFNGYYRDSFDKRERAFHTFLQEQEASIVKDRTIRRLRKELKCLTEVRDASEKRLHKFTTFKNYLHKVKETSHGEYADIREIMDRYSTLAEARESLSEKNDATREYITRKQKTQESDIVMKSNEILAYRNFLSELLEYKDGIADEAQRLDDSLLRIKSTAAQRTKIIGQIKMSIDNLYRQVCKYMHRPLKLNATDTIGQLTDIGISVREMCKLSKDIKHMLKAAFVTAESERITNEKARKKEEERQKRLDKFANRGGTNFRELFELPPLPESHRGISRFIMTEDDD
ncbi:coiled-coil domain-containing protein 42 homolog [Folsomia candida]|uniref:Coiled-coil domain-containing protein 42 n=1 Tax=Folsomia candida TaxID=158441 RepID=A0A226EG04_FOLCA|nr:coiled-coil domain-containing protein 42 homolog [Folsomia candida]OXA56573.1 Coiled-coil domain-containing protein 42 [Folsomia candida]